MFADTDLNGNGLQEMRLLAADPLFYLLGYWYGGRALKWVSEGNAFATRLVGGDGHGLENPAHRKVLYPLAFVMPNNWVSLFCGAARIPIPAFIALNISGTLARLVLCRWLGDLFRSEIKDISDFIARFQWPITAVSVVIVLLGMAVQLGPQVRGIDLQRRRAAFQRLGGTRADPTA